MSSDPWPACAHCGAPAGYQGELDEAADYADEQEREIAALVRRIDLLSNALEVAYRQMEADQARAFDPDREVYMTLVYQALNPGEPS